jgi:hypothetical protein
MCKVKETDCFDSCKLSSVRKKKRPSKSSFERKNGLILETITQTESNATRVLVDNLRK